MKKSILFALISIHLSIVLIIVVQFSPTYKFITMFIVLCLVLLVWGIIFDYKNIEREGFKWFGIKLKFGAQILYIWFTWLIIISFILFPILYNAFPLNDTDTIEFISPLIIAIHILCNLPVITAIVAAILVKPLKRKDLKNEKECLSKMWCIKNSRL